MKTKYIEHDPLYDKYMKLLTASKKKRAKKVKYFWYDEAEKKWCYKKDKDKSRVSEIKDLPRKKIFKNTREYKKYFQYLSKSGKWKAEKQGWYFLNHKKREISIDNEKFNVGLAYLAAMRAIHKYITTKFLDRQYEVSDILQDCVIRIWECSGKMEKFDRNSILTYYFVIAKYEVMKYYRKEVLQRWIWEANESIERRG